jgi:hypothetical protein
MTRSTLHTEDPQFWSDLWNRTVIWCFLLGARKMIHLFARVGNWRGGGAIIVVKISGARVHNTIFRDLYIPGYYGDHSKPSPARNFTYMNPAPTLTPTYRTPFIFLSHLLPGLRRSLSRLRFQDFKFFFLNIIPSPNIFIALLSSK